MAPTRSNLELPRRFYKVVDIVREDGGFAVRLDGRTARTPRQAPVIMPTSELAALVAGEWVEQADFIAFAAMPATRLAHSAVDGVGAGRLEVAESVVGYARSDLLCYFAQGPQSLRRRQEGAWGPLLDWARQALSLNFVQTEGIAHRAQPPATLATLSAVLAGLDDFDLAGVAFASALFGSAILALALREGRVDGQAAHAAARLDEAFQEERWGIDAEAAARAADLLRDAIMLERWFTALRKT